MPLWFEYTLFTLYLLLGPLAWGFAILSMFEGRRKMTLFIDLPPLLDDAPPLTVMVPARNEEANIARCVGSVLEQDYPNLTLVVTDDRSTDATGQILDRFAAKDPRLHVVHATTEDLLPGWTGKSLAIHNAYRKGVRNLFPDPLPNQWLLGLDADMRLTSTDTLSLSMRAALKHQCGIFTLLPALECHTFFEKLVLPLGGMMSSAINAVALTNIVRFKKVAYCNGQYLMIRRELYDAIGGHTQVAPLPCDDVPIAYIVKGRGERIRVGWGEKHCAVRMYDSLGAIVRGLSRIFTVARDRKTWPMWIGISFLLLCGLSLYAALAWTIYRFINPATTYGAVGWLIAVIFHFLTMTVMLAITYAWSGNRWWLALLFPLSGPITLWIYLRALYQCFTGKFEWRGMQYKLDAASKVSTDEVLSGKGG